jgi:copper homeostasis protein
MIRNKPGDFFYTNEQIQEMVTSIKTMQTKYGDKIAGFVFGCLKEGKNITIHEEHTQLLIDAAKPKSITFHKAFDLIQDPIPALQVLINMGVNRVLTSGCSGLGLSGKAINHLDTLRALVQYAKDDIIILAGGGVRSNNAHQILKTGVKEVHSSQIIEL